MAKKFEIFISYRRKGGYDIAKLVYDRLRLDGYSVFFDIDTLRSGSFDKELEKMVKKCRDFVLILSAGIFDRLSKKGYSEEDDWVRQEISCAYDSNKNIVPLIQEGFNFPENLPADIKDSIGRKNTLELNPRHFEATYEKMKESFLVSKPRWAVRHKKSIKNFFIAVFLAFAVYLSFKAYSYHQEALEAIRTEAEQNEQNLMRITDSIKTIADSIKTVMDSIRITSELERKLLTDSISRAVIDSINKVPLRARTVSAPAPAPVPAKAAPAKPAPAKTAPAKTTQQKSSKTTQRSTK